MCSSLNHRSLALLPTSFCDASDKFNAYVSDLTVGLHGAASGIDKLGQHAVAGNLAAASLLAAGGALVLAPIVFGRYWLKPVLTILALLVGAIGSGMLLNEQGADLFDTVSDLAGIPDGEMSCAALLGLQLFGAIILALFVNQIPSLAFFAIGAAGAGFASCEHMPASRTSAATVSHSPTPHSGPHAYLLDSLPHPHALPRRSLPSLLGAPSYSDVSSGLILDLLTDLPILNADSRKMLSNAEESVILWFVGLAALVGGLFFGAFKDLLIDFTLGLLGCALVAQGTMQILTMDVLTKAQMDKYSVDDLYMVYVVALIVLVELFRVLFISVRMGDFASAASQIDYNPGATLMAKVARVSPAKSPAQKKMAASSKNTPSMH